MDSRDLCGVKEENDRIKILLVFFCFFLLRYELWCNIRHRYFVFSGNNYMFCPRWLFEACCGAATNEYLRLDLPIEMIGSKYGGTMADDYQDIDASSVTKIIEAMVIFLNEISAGQNAADYALGFCYYRTVFEKPNSERKIKSMFGSQLDATKVKDYDGNDVLLAFKAYVFALRNNQTPLAPAGWNIKQVEEIDLYQRISAQGGSLLDYL